MLCFFRSAVTPGTGYEGGKPHVASILVRNFDMHYGGQYLFHAGRPLISLRQHTIRISGRKGVDDRGQSEDEAVGFAY